MLRRRSKDGSTPPPRQKSGLACEECRRRKLRCDRQRPQCRVCAESGVECHITNNHPPRGPKPGHIKDLQSRVVALERYMQESQSQDIFLSEITPPEDPFGTRISTDNSRQISPDRVNGGCDILAAAVSFPSSSEPLATTPEMHDELNQLYFDRVHMFIPMLHQRRYYSGMYQDQPATGGPRSCLQHAMWTLAASSSSQFQYLTQSLYGTTRQMLEALPSQGIETAIGEIQAWILVVLYEAKQGNYTQAWVSAGRAFRLVQLMRLFDIDGPNTTVDFLNVRPGEWVEIEERRRTFWTAYLLDRFLNIQVELPLAITEQVVSTRLPAPEDQFQHSQPVLTGFLSEEMAGTTPSQVSPFTECVLLATIWGRCLSHKQLSSVESIYGDTSQDIWVRHQWLHSTLMRRIRALSSNYPAASQQIDPMLIFTIMVAQTALIYLNKVIESKPCETTDRHTTVTSCKAQALVAGQQVIDLTKALAQLSQAKVHPLTAIPLSVGAEFFISHWNVNESGGLQVQDIGEAMRNIQNRKNLAQNYLQLLKLDQIALLEEVVPDSTLSWL
ncbi:fungal-specific transcription factor domain-containing protein [Aspergillus cavernicola]|uniref:Fungal-specific transcription factor domain-containing protein n=1 Tax=Aspergillus cavernicola TaxID=176166 RepID=A0ABR4HGN9_9EURO